MIGYGIGENMNIIRVFERVELVGLAPRRRDKASTMKITIDK